MKDKFVYIVKIKGKTKIPDYIQIRDENYTLVAYFRADRPEKALEKFGLSDQIERFKDYINKLPFGKMHKINLYLNE